VVSVSGELPTVAVELFPRRDQVGAVLGEGPPLLFVPVVNLVRAYGLTENFSENFGNPLCASDQIGGEPLVIFVMLGWIGVHRREPPWVFATVGPLKKAYA
jgi:hypothetical protein